MYFTLFIVRKKQIHWFLWIVYLFRDSRNCQVFAFLLFLLFLISFRFYFFRLFYFCFFFFIYVRVPVNYNLIKFLDLFYLYLRITSMKRRWKSEKNKDRNKQFIEHVGTHIINTRITKTGKRKNEGKNKE